MKRFQILFTVTLFLVSLLIVSGCGKKAPAAKGENLLSLVPENAAGAFAVDFKKVAELDIFTRMIDDLKKKTADPESKDFESYQDFVDKTGIDPQKDFHAMVFALFGDLQMSGQVEPDFAAVIKLNYDKSKLLELIKGEVKKAKQDLGEETYKGLTYFKSEDEKGKEIAFSFMSDELIVLGRPSQLKQVIDLFKGEGKNILDNERVKPYLEKVGGEMVSFFFDFPAEAKKVHDTGMFKVDLSKAELFFGYANYKGSAWNGEIQLVSKNPEGNEQLVTTLNGFKGMAAMGGPEAAELVNAIDLTSSADAIKISFNITDELIKKLQEKVKAPQTGLAAPPPGK